MSSCSSHGVSAWAETEFIFGGWPLAALVVMGFRVAKRIFNLR